MSDSNKPKEMLRDGRVKASIWENETEKGTFHSVSFARTYQDADGNYMDSNSFSGTDLLKVSRLAGQSYDTIQELRDAREQFKDANEQNKNRQMKKDRGMEM